MSCNPLAFRGVVREPPSINVAISTLQRAFSSLKKYFQLDNYLKSVLILHIYITMVTTRYASLESIGIN